MSRRSSSDPALGAVLRKLREERGLSQEALAVRAGTTAGTLARLELGQSDPSWSTICAVAEALDVRLREVIAAVEAQRAAKRHE
jgi:transcriptional regulator with XRE-family HTH domain